MNNSLIQIDTNDFKNKVNIKFNNILDGFDLFKNFNINGSIANGEKQIIEFIETIFEENSNDTYIDFYISNLSFEEKNNLFSLINNDDREILKEVMDTANTGIYFKLNNKNLIPFLVRLNTRELFFVTFYFSKKPITVWGNYNMNFPCFIDNDENLKYYSNLAFKLGLC